ncbi:MAG: single-stranded-DNA-specific exonuclease RecJ [Spirochaetaceae bacterium]|jgi:single-stranded-DNA-specific exonuclease|nr:single-stranded-DNA-specific exonuclease RecJ [Spirochaetaceae bacterium]
MKWNKKDAPPELVKEIAAKYGCDLCSASVLIRRGLTAGEDLIYYLEGDKRYLRNPFELDGMDDAVERVLAAIEEGEKILIFGDRDTDGVTSLTIVTHFLRGVCKSPDDVFWKLPEYDEPYGLSMEAVEFASRNSISLIITVDCGISDFEEVKRANELNIDVIVTDHHKPQERLPEAHTVIDPKLTKDGAFLYPFADLAGCGVAYKLVSALRFARGSAFYNEPLCFFNVSPANDDSYLIEIIKTRNLAVTSRLSETIVPGAVKIGATRLPRFLEGQQICVYDGAAQKKMCEGIFGRSIEFAMLDMAPLFAEEIPQTKGKSLLRLKDVSRIALYSSKPPSEAQVLYNLFVSYARKKEKIFAGDDDEDLQLAAIGTIADLMPLVDENRIIVKAGLTALLKKPRSGISDLIYKFNLNIARLCSTDVSWQLTPAINSAGRLGEAGTPVKLLLETDKLERDKLVNRIKMLNDQRRDLADNTWDLVKPRAEENKDMFFGNLSFAAGDDIKRGVTGGMANRLSNAYKLPSLILSYNNDIVTGSMRSVRGYDLQGILEMGRDLFIDSGGHNYAAGFSLKKENVDEFLSRLKDFSQTIELNAEPEFIEVDAELPLSYLTPEIFKVIDRLEPFGKGNREISFLARSLKIIDIDFIGRRESKHVKLKLDAGKYKWPSLFWGAADRISEGFKVGDVIDAIFVVRRNFFNGQETPQLVIIDLEKKN